MKWLRPSDNKVIFLISMIIISTLLIRLLMHYRFDKSGLLYIGIPFFIAIALAWFTKGIEEPSWKQKFWNHSRMALIIMLGSSIILFEGFLCVVMFMPIYFAIMVIVFIIKYFQHKKNDENRSSLSAHIFPILVIIAAMEGTHENLSFDRTNNVSASQDVDLSTAEIHASLKQAIQIDHDRPWFLSLFPMPYQVDAGSLQTGDVHQVHFRYHRWFVTNTHQGSMSLRIAKVSEREIKTEVIEDSSYIASYMKLHGTKINLEPITDKQTRITLSVSYDRLLDPSWYFGPLQRYGIGKMAEYLISDIIVANHYRLIALPQVSLVD